MALTHMEDLPQLPAGPIEPNDIFWLSRDNGDDTRTSYKIDVVDLLALVKNIYTQNGTIPASTQRVVTVGAASTLSIITQFFGVVFGPNYFVINGITFRQGSINFSGPGYGSTSFLFNGGGASRMVEIDLVSGSVMYSFKGLFKQNGSDTEILGIPYELIMGDDTGLTFEVIPTVGSYGFEVKVTALTLGGQSLNVYVKQTGQ